MVICEDLLFSHGAQITEYNAGDYIFQEGTSAKFYFQIKGGTVKLNTFTEEGKEFVHGLPLTATVLGKAICLQNITMRSMLLPFQIAKLLSFPKVNFCPFCWKSPLCCSN